jgi:hypothetical protein
MRTSTILLTLATSALVAADFSLSDVETVSKSEVTTTCYTAYTATLDGCTSSGSTCSSTCVASVKSAASSIQSACADAFTGVDSLLRRTLDGGLLTIMCPDAVSSGSTSTKSSKSATTTTAEAKIVESTMVASSINVLSTTITTATAKATGALEVDTASVAPTSEALIDIDTAPTSTADVSGSTSFAPLFASETPSASSSAHAATESGVDNAAGAVSAAKWTVAGVAVVMGALMA